MNFGNDQTYAHASRSGGNKYALKPLSGRSSKFGGSNRAWEKMSRDKQMASQGVYHTEATAYATKGGNEREGSIRSGISQHPIIRYQVDYEVRHERKDGESGTSES